MQTEFTAEVIETLRDERGFGVILPETIFYPTSGGQAHDTGAIGKSRVMDVVLNEGQIIHYVDKEIEIGSYPAKIDWKRRFANMQHHTGQHILSAAFWQEMQLETISSHISSETPATIDFETDSLSPAQLARVEDVANGIVFENRTVKTYFVHDKGDVPFRRAPKVAGEIRVIDIEGFDYSACGGTHTPQTGMVGMLKIVRIERINQKTRIHFVAGAQALQFFRAIQDSAQASASLMDVGFADTVEAIQRLQTQLKEAERELKELRQIKLEAEAEQIAQFAEQIGEKWLLTKIYENRDVGELRHLALRLRQYPMMIALLGSYAGNKLSFVVACAENTDLNASELLRDHLSPYGGRGGGDAFVAQGGCTTDDISTLFQHSREMVRNS